jgi:hypothetical protein
MYSFDSDLSYSEYLISEYRIISTTGEQFLHRFPLPLLCETETMSLVEVYSDSLLDRKKTRLD